MESPKPYKDRAPAQPDVLEGIANIRALMDRLELQIMALTLFAKRKKSLAEAE